MLILLHPCVVFIGGFYSAGSGRIKVIFHTCRLRRSFDERHGADESYEAEAGNRPNGIQAVYKRARDDKKVQRI